MSARGSSSPSAKTRPARADSVTGVVCTAWDVDFFKAKASKAGTASVTLTPAAGRNRVLAVYDSGQQRFGHRHGERLHHRQRHVLLLKAPPPARTIFDPTGTYTLSWTWP